MFYFKFLQIIFCTEKIKLALLTEMKMGILKGTKFKH